jgi:hypothetical protein
VTVRRSYAIAVPLVLVIAAAIGLVFFLRSRARQSTSLQGAIMVQDPDARKERPISGVEVSERDGLAIQPVKSDDSGFFLIRWRKGIRHGHAVTLEFRHPDYHPLELHEFVGDQLFVVRMVPNSVPVPNVSDRPAVKIGNVRVRYSLKTMSAVNIGSVVKTFEVENQGNVPCRNQHPCSPDGKWNAALGSASLDAGTGNEFRDATASCIAGPCPFARIESDRLSRGGQIITVTARDWSDTTTFLLEAEVFHPMASEIVHEFYPVIFGRGLSFTLPTAAEGVTIEADVDDQRVFFPLGPSLLLSWASCNAGVTPDQTRVCRCELKPGYRFQ